MMRTTTLSVKNLFRKSILMLCVLALTASCFQLTAHAAALVWPVPSSHSLSQHFHDGNAIDISAPTGATIVAAMSGKVTTIHKCEKTHLNYGDCNGFGTGLVILGDDGRAYQYAHMQAGSIPANVYYGARVSAGQMIGRVGKTGYATGPHLHFGISYNRNYWEAGPNPEYQAYGSAGQDLSSVKIGSQSAANITKTNAKLSATLYKSPGINASNCGIYLGTSSGGMTKRNVESIGSATNNYNGGKSFNIWYDLTGELGIVLNPGTTYYYRFYATVNGKEIQGPTASFKTADNPKPVVKPTAKKQQNMYLVGTASNISYSRVRKNDQSFVLLTLNAKGKVTYTASSKYVKVSGSKVTVKKGAPKGTYKITVKAAGNSSYNACTKTWTFRVR